MLKNLIVRQDRTIKWIIVHRNGSIWATGPTKKNCIFMFNYIVGKNAYEECLIKGKVYRLVKAAVYWQELS